MKEIIEVLRREGYTVVEGDEGFTVKFPVYFEQLSFKVPEDPEEKTDVLVAYRMVIKSIEQKTIEAQNIIYNALCESGNGHGV